MSAGHVARAAGVVLALAAGGFLAFLAAGAMTAATTAPATPLLTRAALVTLALVTVTVRAGRSRSVGTVALLAALGYAVSPATWVGRAYLAQLWFAPGPATAGIDLVAWVGVATGSAALAGRRRAAVRR